MPAHIQSTTQQVASKTPILLLVIVDSNSRQALGYGEQDHFSASTSTFVCLVVRNTSFSQNTEPKRAEVSVSNSQNFESIVNVQVRVNSGWHNDANQTST